MEINDVLYRIRITVRTNDDFTYEDIRPLEARGYIYFNSYRDAIFYMRKHINQLIETFNVFDTDARTVLIMARNISDYLSIINVSTSDFLIGDGHLCNDKYSLIYELTEVQATPHEKFMYFKEVNE